MDDDLRSNSERLWDSPPYRRGGLMRAAAQVQWALIGLVTWLLLSPALAFACPDCLIARGVRASVFDERFWGQLFIIVLPLALLSIGSIVLYRAGAPGTRSAWRVTRRRESRGGKS